MIDAKGAVAAFAMSPDGTKLATGGADMVVRVWNAADGALIKEIAGSDAADRRAGVQGRRQPGRVRPGQQGRPGLQRRRRRRGQEDRGPPPPVTALAFRADGAQVAAAGEDNQIRVINAADGAVLKALPGHAARIHALAFAPNDGNLLVSASADKTAKLWNVNEGKPVRDFAGHADAVLALDLSRDGTKLVTGSADKTDQGLDRRRRQERRHARRATPGRSRRSSSPTTAPGSPAARPTTRSASGTPPPAASCRPSPRTAAAILGVAILPDNESVVSAGPDNKVRVWKPAAVRVFAGHRGPIFGVAVHPNGSQVFTASADKTVKVFDVNTGNVVRTLAGHGDAVRAVAVTKDAAKVVTGSADKTVRTWNAADGKPLLTYPGAADRRPGRWPPRADNKLLAAGLADNTAKVFDLTQADPAKAERQ